jgi:hypothetical protein
MAEHVALHGIVHLILRPSDDWDESRLVVVCRNWLLHMPHENHWPPRVTPRRAEFDDAFARCVSGDRKWSLPDVRLLLGDGEYRGADWSNARLELMVPTAPLVMSSRLGADTASPFPPFPPLDWIRTRHYCGWCYSTTCHCASTARNPEGRSLDAGLPTALLCLALSYTSTNDHAHALQTCRRMRTAAMRPEASPRVVQYYVHTGTEQETGLRIDKLYATLPRLSPCVLRVGNSNGPRAPGYNRAAAALWRHVGEMRSLRELDVRECTWALWFRPQSHSFLHIGPGVDPDEDRRHNNDAVTLFTGLGVRLPTLSTLRLSSVCAQHPGLSFAGFQSLNTLEAEWLEACCVRQLPTSLTSLSIGLLRASSPATAMTPKEVSDSFTHLMPGLHTLILPSREPSIALALAVLPHARLLDRFECSSRQTDILNRGEHERHFAIQLAWRESRLLCDPANVAHFGIARRRLRVAGVTDVAALENLLTVEHMCIEQLEIEAYLLYAFPDPRQGRADADTKVASETLLEKVRSALASSSSPSLSSSLFLAPPLPPRFPSLREFHFESRLAVGGAVLAKLVRSRVDMPQLAVLRLHFRVDIGERLDAQLLHLSELPRLASLSLQLQFDVNEQSHRARIKNWIPTLPGLTEFEFGLVPEIGNPYRLQPEFFPRLRTLRLENAAVIGFQAKSVPPELTALDLSTKSVDGVLNVQHELLGLPALRQLKLNSSLRPFSFSDLFDTLRDRGVTLMFADTT